MRGGQVPKTAGKWRFAAAAAVLLIAGCGDEFFDPTQIGRFRPVPAVNVILDSLGVAEETPVAWAGAEDPKPIDVMVFETDYVFGPGDIVRVSIFELLQEGAPLVNDYVVTETGKISIPEVGVVQAAGLTESQLEEEIRQILSPGILKDPSVTVISISSQQRTFSILGNGIPGPGRYNIPRYDFRLTDALATAGGISQFNISYIYVSRSIEVERRIEQAGEPADYLPPVMPEDGEAEMLEVVAPRAQKPFSAGGLVIAAAEMAEDPLLAEAARPEGFGPGDRAEEDAAEAPPAEAPPAAGADVAVEPAGEPEGRIEWVFRDGRWVPVQVGRRPAAAEKGRAEPLEVPEDFGGRILPDTDWDDLGRAEAQRRVLKIPAHRLLAGDPRYNVVIRPNDSIHIPVDIIGEFCIMGNVNAQGYINLTGRPMTLKMAIAAAGGLGPLAWPKRCEVVRRIASDKEEIVMVDLEKISRGEQPDFFVKPNDLINVGTHPTARWRAILRNAFRATYGFGFIYDRNYADRDVGTRRPIPDWF
jgi:polysaccharide export outer membrane protein